jgi:hypothetical protein
MLKKPKHFRAEPSARFQRFCDLLLQDSNRNAYRAAIGAGYTKRMAKSKSYKLAARIWRNPGFRSRWRALHVTPYLRRLREEEAERERQSDIASLLARAMHSR